MRQHAQSLFVGSLVAGLFSPLCLCQDAADGLATGSDGWPFVTQGDISSRPFCDAEQIYFGACGGIFYCLDKETAALKWKREGYRCDYSSPIVFDGKVCFASSGFTMFTSRLHALSAEDGTPLWRTKWIRGVGHADPRRRGNRLLASATNQVVEVKAKNGKIAHRYAFEGEYDDFAWNSNGIVIVASRDLSPDDNYTGKGAVCFYNHQADAQLWKTELGASCLGRIACDEERCYLGARDGIFRALKTEDGSVAWEIDSTELFTKKRGTVWADGHVMVTADKVLFTVDHQFITSPGILVCVSKDNGNVLWTMEHPSSLCGSFVLVDEHVICVAEDRCVVSVDLNSGASRAFDLLPPKANHGGFVGVVHSEGYLFIASEDTCVHRLALDAVTGEDEEQRNVPEKLEERKPRSADSMFTRNRDLPAFRSILAENDVWQPRP